MAALEILEEISRRLTKSIDTNDKLDILATYIDNQCCEEAFIDYLEEYITRNEYY